MKDSNFQSVGLKMTLSWLGLSPYSAPKFLGCSTETIVAAQRGQSELPDAPKDRLEDLVDLLGNLIVVLREHVNSDDHMIVFRNVDAFASFMGIEAGGAKVGAAYRMFWRAVTLFFEDMTFAFEDPFLDGFHASRSVDWLPEAEVPVWLAGLRIVIQGWVSEGVW